MSTMAEKWVSQGLEKGREEGLEKGLEKGELIGQIRAFQEVLGLEVQTLESLGSLDRKALESEVSRLRQKLRH